MKFSFLLAATSALLMTSACTQKKTAEIPTLTPAEQLIERLDSLRSRGIMYAHQDDPFYGVTWEWQQGRSDTKDLLGDYPAVMGFDLGGLELGDAKNLDSVPFTWIREEAIKQIERGGIITFSWHPHNPSTVNTTAWDVSDTTVVRNILPGGPNYERWMGWMSNVAEFLKTIADENEKPYAFILRPWHEYNGSWFWWGQKLCSDEEFKAFWNMFQDYMNEQLPTNIVWSQSPNLQGNWTEEEFLRRYVGDERVDLVGEDCYQWGSEEDFMAQCTNDVQFLSAFAQQHGKLFAITECGKQNSPTADWWSRVFLPCVKSAQPCYFLPWRNWSADHFGLSKDVPTADDAKQLYETKQFLLVKDIL